MPADEVRLTADTDATTLAAENDDLDDASAQTEPTGRAGQQDLSNARKPLPPQRRNVTPADLQGAEFVETYAGLHLFALADGRIFVDRHEAMQSLDEAKSLIDALKAKKHA